VNNKKEFYEGLFAQFVYALGGVSVVGLNPVQVLALYMALIREHVGRLREKVLEFGFLVMRRRCGFLSV